MDVLFVTSHFGSSETIGFMPVVATELAKQGHDVRGVQYENTETIDSIPVERRETTEIHTPYWGGQWLFYRDWEPTIHEYLSTNESDLDVVVTDRRCTVPTIRAAADLDIPVVGVVPGLGFTRFNPGNLKQDKTPRFWQLPVSAKIQYPFVQSLHRQHARGLRLADDIVVVSEFLGDCLQTTYGVDSTVVRTPIVPETIRVDTHEPEAVTMVNPRSELKGGNIFLDVAENMPNQKFLVAGTFATEDQAQRAESLPNVTWLGWVDDMREIYARTAILLVPSLVEEGGPRVIAEAFANGIPAVGTGRGGVPEFVGDAGVIVDPPRDITQWTTGIQRIMDDYASYSKRADDLADQFYIEGAIAEMERILRSAVE